MVPLGCRPSVLGQHLAGRCVRDLVGGLARQQPVHYVRHKEQPASMGVARGRAPGSLRILVERIEGQQLNAGLAVELLGAHAFCDALILKRKRWVSVATGWSRELSLRAQHRVVDAPAVNAHRTRDDAGFACALDGDRKPVAHLAPNALQVPVKLALGLDGGVSEAVTELHRHAFSVEDAEHHAPGFRA